MNFSKNTEGILSLTELLELHEAPPKGQQCPRCGGLLVEDQQYHILDCSRCEKMFDLGQKLLDTIH